MTKLGKKRLLHLSFLIYFVTLIPYVLAYARSGSEWVFSGFLLGVEDGNSYLAKMLIGTSGEWLFRSPYSTFDQNGFLAFFPYILLGKLASSPAVHSQLVVLFHTYRLVATTFLFFCIYLFSTIILKEEKYRLYFTLLCCLGGGLGFAHVIGLKSLWGERIPLEFYSPETFGFLSILTLPHLAMARGFLLLGLYNFLLGISSANWRYSFMAGLCFLFIGFFQPLTILIAWMCSGLAWLLYVFLEKSKNLPVNFSKKDGLKYLGYLSFSIIISFPWVVYNWISFHFDPYLQSWAKQNLVLSPPALDYFWAYGIFVPIIIAGAIFLFKREGKWISLFLLSWILGGLFLTFTPFNLQRRLCEGVWVAIAMLIVYAIENSNSKKIQRVFLTGSQISFLSPLFIIAGALLVVFNPSMPVYYPADQIEAFEYFDQFKDFNPVVLSAYDSANVLPAWHRVTMLTGHGSETAKFEQVQEKIREFYQVDSTDSYRRELLDSFHVDFVFWGPVERDLGAWNPQTADYLHCVYFSGEYYIYIYKFSHLYSENSD